MALQETNWSSLGSIPQANGAIDRSTYNQTAVLSELHTSNSPSVAPGGAPQLRGTTGIPQPDTGVHTTTHNLGSVRGKARGAGTAPVSLLDPGVLSQSHTLQDGPCEVSP